MSFTISYVFNPINTLLAVNSINAFGILWAGCIWMIAGFIAGLLASVPIGFIILSMTNSDTIDPAEPAFRAALFVVSTMTLLGLIYGSSLEYDKQMRSSPEAIYGLSLEYGKQIRSLSEPTTTQQQISPSIPFYLNASKVHRSGLMKN